ncbi:hypothetical protein ACFV2H_43650 [Streptomyces sp. NPDC059629]|uniref:hypothetical protein n=1 Tax=Streptomyces sp. NPDC059629 TaxID=3346889 RepID=UPI003696B406
MLDLVTRDWNQLRIVRWLHHFGQELGIPPPAAKGTAPGHPAALHRMAQEEALSAAPTDPEHEEHLPQAGGIRGRDAAVATYGTIATAILGTPAACIGFRSGPRTAAARTCRRPVAKLSTSSVAADSEVTDFGVSGSGCVSGAGSHVAHPFLVDDGLCPAQGTGR